MADSLTPTEDLVMEVLSARYRLGETLWTFDSRIAPAILRLQDKGLVNHVHGMVENSVRASLTDAGRKMYVIDSYKAPIFEKYKLKKKYR